jgi:hypothetical protein
MTGPWSVPFEVAVCACSVATRRVIRARLKGGMTALPIATVTLRGNRYWAEIGFAGPGLRALLTPLDARIWYPSVEAR